MTDSKVIISLHSESAHKVIGNSVVSLSKLSRSISYSPSMLYELVPFDNLTYKRSLGLWLVSESDTYNESKPSAI